MKQYSIIKKEFIFMFFGKFTIVSFIIIYKQLKN